MSGDSIPNALTHYLDLEALAFMHPDLVPAMKLAEQKLIASLRRYGGGSYYGNSYSLRVETCTMAGVLLGEWVTMKGDLPVTTRSVCVPGTIAWPRGLRPDVVAAIGAAKS